MKCSLAAHKRPQSCIAASVKYLVSPPPPSRATAATNLVRNGNGNSAGDGDMPAVTRGAPGGTEPVCVGLDDEPMMRKVHRVLFQHFLAADMRRSCSLGATGAELECFLDVALGRCQPLSIDYAL